MQVYDTNIHVFVGSIRGGMQELHVPMSLAAFHMFTTSAVAHHTPVHVYDTNVHQFVGSNKQQVLYEL